MDLSPELRAEVEDFDGYITASSGQGGECIYAKRLSNGMVAIRDSEQPDVYPTVVRGAVWEKFAEGVKAGVFDHL
ncbi:protein of unknown function [Nonomuraea jiangxiensis]|uniref:DUF397 domain-containing protein n=1 Tax=Nonomuraea jiangxiensis TaxID=633440 RepID=A0A1G8UQY2_9ACTN|nr:DUF397 domain-containing protein [Nonomuraea jiangxiensis]SDJ56296.1 protein of unknown function [Nonomuraea jiangxiensis]